MRTNLILILILKSVIAFSQSNFQAKDLIVTDEVLGNLTIETYKDLDIFKGNKCIFSENSAEKVFCDFFNLNNTEEFNIFFKDSDIPTSYRDKNYLEKMKLYDNKKNYYHLDSKYIFDNGITKDIFIKYINYNETFPKPVYSIFYIQNFDNKLIVKDMGENMDIALFLVATNTQRTLEYLKKNSNIDITSISNSFFESFRKKDLNNEILKLSDKTFSPFDKNIEQDILKNEENVYHFNYKKEFNNIIEGNVLEEEISKQEALTKYKIPIEILKDDILFIEEILKVNISNDIYTIIKFKGYKPIVKLKEVIVSGNIVNNNNTLFVLTRVRLYDFVDICFSQEKGNPKFLKYRNMVQENDKIIMPKLREIVETNKNIFF